MMPIVQANRRFCRGGAGAADRNAVLSFSARHAPDQVVGEESVRIRLPTRRGGVHPLVYPEQLVVGVHPVVVDDAVRVLARPISVYSTDARSCQLRRKAFYLPGILSPKPLRLVSLGQPSQLQ